MSPTRCLAVAIAVFLQSPVAWAQTQALSEREANPDNKIRFAEIAKRFVGKGIDGFSAPWCPVFMRALRDEQIRFIDPVLETDDGSDPELSAYNRCKDQQFFEVGAGGWSPEDKYLEPGGWSAEAKIRTDDVLIIPWNLRYRSVVPDIGHGSFKLYRLPDLAGVGMPPMEVIYGKIDPEQDKANENYLRLDAPGRRTASGYWIIETKQCYAKWRDMWVGHRPFDVPSYHAIVRYRHEYYVLKAYPDEASPWLMELELIGHRKMRMSKWRPCVWSGDIR